MKWLRKLWRKAMGNWWYVVRPGGGTSDGRCWGVWHPYKHHSWACNMTEQEAQAECDRRNNE
jgi:hypothetical protein